MTDLSSSRVDAFFSSDLIRSKVTVGHSSSSFNQVQRHQTCIAWGCPPPLPAAHPSLQIPLNDGKSNGSVKGPWSTGGGGMAQDSHGFKYYHIHDQQPRSSCLPSPCGLQGPSSPVPFLIKHHYICSLKEASYSATGILCLFYLQNLRVCVASFLPDSQLPSDHNLPLSRPAINWNHHLKLHYHLVSKGLA